MSIEDFYQAIILAENINDIQSAVDEFEVVNRKAIKWVPVGGRENNRGIIDVSRDTGRSLVERLTNGIDAILELEHEQHQGIPDCRSPKEAAVAWLNIPDGGLSELSPARRRSIGQKVSVTVKPGEGKHSRVVELRDFGIGLKPEQMPSTILSLNESNKVSKHYLAGAYGQGGSSTFAASRYTLIVSRYGTHPFAGFTVVRYDDLSAEEYKIGHYVYLTLEGNILTAELTQDKFPAGTLVKHFGYDLSDYSLPLGPNSLYGLLNQVLFDPVLPVWLDNSVHNYRRLIKGARNSLNGAVDDGDEERRGPKLTHQVRLFYTSLGEYGQIGVEYWVLESPTSTNRQPIKAFVNPSKPIVLTLNGQNHAELPQILIRKNSDLPYLSQRLICHIDCNHLTANAKRALFVSNREDARRGMVYELIQQEIVRILRSDDELTRLNNEAREQSRRTQDETEVQRVRQEVARLLRLHGINIVEGMGGGVIKDGKDGDVPKPRPHPRPVPQPIELHEPPTYIRIKWEDDQEITFYPSQRRYIRIETDANSKYHNAADVSTSRVNIISIGNGIKFQGSTPLEGGRMRAIFDGDQSSLIGTNGLIRVELNRVGLPVLTDERSFRIVEPPPPARPTSRQVTVPSFRTVPVDGLEDPNWTNLGWPENIQDVASEDITEPDGTLVIYYSTIYPKYLEQRVKLEHRDTMLADSFTKKYEIWIAVHSLLLYQDKQNSSKDNQHHRREDDTDFLEAKEREERNRFATIATLIAAREVQSALVDESE
jgi:hypothetical protein